MPPADRQRCESKSVPSEIEEEKLNGKPSQANAIFVCDGF